MTSYPPAFPADSAEIVLRYHDGTGTDTCKVVRNACWDLCGWSNGQKDAQSDGDTMPPPHEPVCAGPTPAEVAAQPVTPAVAAPVPSLTCCTDAEMVGCLKELVDHAKGVKKVESTPAKETSAKETHVKGSLQKEGHAREAAKTPTPKESVKVQAPSFDWAALGRAFLALLLKLSA